MSQYETILFALESGIARLTLNRPDRLNSFTARMHEEVQDALALAADGARVLVLTGALYVIWGTVSGHFRKHLLPDASDRSLQAFSRALARHLRFARPAAADAWSYNLVQRLTYVLVIFVLFPLVIWTGLAMSPAFVSAVPSTVTLLGGRQSARTLHFLVSVSLVAFLLVHVAMVWFAGFGTRVMAMITGAPAPTRGPE